MAVNPEDGSMSGSWGKPDIDTGPGSDRGGGLGPSRRQFLGRFLVVGAAAAMMPPLLSACAGSSGGTTTAGGKPQRGGTLTFARNSDTSSVDPAAVGDNESIWVVSTLFDRLYQSSPRGDGTSLPSLATGHSVSADKLTWTFPLRTGVTFSDGTPMTSADVKYSIDRCTKSDENGYINVAIDSVTTPDPHTVVIKTKYQTELLGIVSYFANGVLPNNLQGKDTEAFFKAPIGTGPFVMTTWDVGRQMILKRNPHYWQAGLPYLDQVIFTVVADDNSRILQLRGGQADVIESPPWSQFSTIKGERGVSVKTFPSTIVDFLSLNERVPQLADVNVRNAISLAIDRGALVRVALFGNGTPGGSIFPPTWPFADPSIQAPAQDLAAAKAAIAKSKYPSGFSMTYSVDGGDTVQGAVAQLIQTDLSKVGIKVSIKQYDSNTLETLVGKGDFDTFQDLLSLDIMDPFENVPYLVDPSVGGDGEYADYNDPQVIAWANEAAATSDPTVIKNSYYQIQQRIQRDSPFIPLFYVPYAYGVTDKVQDLVVPPTGDYRLESAWLAG
jgi:peptide/nickel transport system substrate-binding protein